MYKIFETKLNIRESSELSATALSERRADFAGRGSEANAHCEQAR